MIGLNQDWKSIESVADAKSLIDRGVLPEWKECISFRKKFSADQKKEIVEYLVNKFVERHDSRLSAEIVIETTIIWLANMKEEFLVSTFLESYLGHPRCESSIFSFAEIILSTDYSEHEHGKEMFSLGVSLVCEVGIGFDEVSRAYPDMFKKSQRVFNHLATYLLSVSNDSEMSTRLSLLNYFGKLSSSGRISADYLDRIMNRFGYTVLDNLFHLLLCEKKTEGVAMQFMRNNFGYLLGGGIACQKTVFETMKFYMLKKPERFCLFVQTFAEYATTKDNFLNKNQIIHNFAQHIYLLLKVASDVNHKIITKELLQATLFFKGNPSMIIYLERLKNDASIRENFKSYIQTSIKLLKNEKVKNSIVSQLKPSRRGRKPSFAKTDTAGTIGQVGFLSNTKILKAS